METNEIRRRLLFHVDRINALATLLPASAQLNFFAVDTTEQADIAERKRLVLTVVQIDQSAVAAIIAKAGAA